MSKAPRILFIDQSGQLGGAELFLLDVAGFFWERAEVALFEEGPFHEALVQAGIPVTVLDEKIHVQKESGLLQSLAAIPKVLKLIFRLARLARRHDIVYANTAKAFIIGSLAAHLAGRPLVYHLHDIVSRDHFSRLNQRLLVGCANRLTRCLIANSQASLEAFQTAGCRLRDVHVVYNGFAAVSPSSIGSESAAEIRTRLGLEGKPVVSIIGRLTPWKGQHIFLQALQSLPGVHGLIIGEALFTDEDRSYAEQLRAQSQEGNLAGRIHFLGFQRNLTGFYKASDIIVHCSIAPEPFGRVIVEGMLAGKPVLATNLGGAREIITQGVTGLLLPAGDPAALASAIGKCLENPRWAQALATEGQRYAAATFALEGIVQRIDLILKSLPA